MAIKSPNQASTRCVEGIVGIASWSWEDISSGVSNDHAKLNRTAHVCTYDAHIWPYMAIYGHI